MNRVLLTRLFIVTVALGTGVVLWVFLQAFSPAQDKIPSTLKIDLTKIPLDSYQELEWDNKPVAIFRAGPKTLAALAALNETTKGPYFTAESNPVAFVYFTISTNRGCGLIYKENFGYEPQWDLVWVDPCHGFAWDRAGRDLSGGRLSNLKSPVFQISENKRYVELR